jgi:DNA-binding NtrC family response regulator
MFTMSHAPSHVEQESAVSSGHPDLRGKSVLIVEDEFMIALDYALHLETLGVAVLGPVSNVSQALSLIRENSIDAAILDIDLQGTKSFIVADALLEHDVKFIFATGYNDVVIPARFSHVVRCEKPASPTEIANAIRLVCES